MPINTSSHVPIYKQIVEDVRGSIAAGVFRPDEMLPSIRALALELIVNPNTVQRAYQELERAGLVYARKGVGMFVAERSPESARNGSETAVHDAFSQGVEIGKRADMSSARLRTVFERTLKDNTTSYRTPEVQEDD